MTSNSSTIKYVARDYFKPFHNRTQRYSIVICHRRGGKTVASIVDLIFRALNCNKYRPKYAYIAPYRSQAENIAWDYLLEFTKGIRSSSNKSELYVVLKKNNAIIRLFGADNDKALRGMYLDGVILDEFADFREHVWGEVVRPMLADRKGWACFIGTPRGHNAFYDLWRKSKDNPELYYRSMLAYWDTNILDKQEISEIKHTTSDSQFRQEFCCDFEAAVTGSFYGELMEIAQKEGRIGNYYYNSLYPVYTAWDLGFTDSTAIWFFQVYDSKVRVIDYYEASGEGVDHYASLLKSKPYEYKAHYLPADSRQQRMESGGRSILMQLATFFDISTLVVLGKQNVLDGIAAVRVTLPVCYFHEEACSFGLECLRLYRRDWDSLKSTWCENPRKDKYTHGADAFRYLAMGWIDVKEKTPSTVSIEDIIKQEQNVTIDHLIKQHLRKVERSRYQYNYDY